MNAASPSIASGAPNTSPTNSEYTDQFMPNWNSWTRPVATPIAKLISISVPKKRVSRSHASSPPRYQIVCITATSGASPSVSGTKRKWYSDVIANCVRARSTVDTATLTAPALAPSAGDSTVVATAPRHHVSPRAPGEQLHPGEFRTVGSGDC